jgi:uncharacterized protein YeaO (DUF488 family)
MSRARPSPRPGVRTARVYAPRDPADGTRVLVMRLWPRGVARARVDLWMPELGAPREDLRAWKAGRIGWPELRRRYLAWLRQPAPARDLAELAARARRERLTLLCACLEERRCHRSLLRRRLAAPRRRPARPARASGRGRIRRRP